MRASMYGASGISTAACTLATATHVHLHDDQCTCINSGRLQGDIRLTKLAALRGAKPKKKEDLQLQFQTNIDAFRCMLYQNLNVVF